MVCLNKADKGTFRHQSYNQSPPALAAHATTRQDLNGIANLRQYVAAGQKASGGATAGLAGQTVSSEKLRRQLPGDSALATTGLERLWSWITWILSVLIVSYLFSRLRAPTCRCASSGTPSIPVLSARTHETDLPPKLVKRSSCATGGVNKDAYNTGLHAAALFIIWFVSSLACAFPIAAAKFPGLRIPRRFFFAVRHFGTGVLIATALVHLLPTAFVSLGNPCLGTFWTKDYEAMPGAIALLAIFLVTVIEMAFHPSRHGPPADMVARRQAKDRTGVESADPEGHSLGDMGPLHGLPGSMARGLPQLNRAAPMDEISLQAPAGDSTPAKISAESARPTLEEPTLTPSQKRDKERLQCILLEMGILFHSVFIGMALSVSVGNDFIVLLIAIAFHQTFEGLALGSRISVIAWGSRTWQPWLMAFAYGCTTPLGQAIGLATHSLYSPESEIGLVLVGVMNAVSAGLLTFASLVELLSEDFLSDESWRRLRGKRRVTACLLVFLGALCMSLVGAWA